MATMIEPGRRSGRTLIKYEIGVLIRFGQSAGTELTKEGERAGGIFEGVISGCN